MLHLNRFRLEHAEGLQAIQLRQHMLEVCLCTFSQTLAFEVYHRQAVFFYNHYFVPVFSPTRLQSLGRLTETLKTPNFLENAGFVAV